MKIKSVSAAVLATAALSVFAASTEAANASSKPFEWTGFYAGINAGYAGGGESWRFVANNGPADQWPHGGIAGGTLGWNFLQVGRYVFGLEGDFDWAGISGRSACPANSSFTCTTKISNFGSLRGRAGYTLLDNQLLAYVTAGTAGGRINPTAPGPIPEPIAPKTAWGWTAGFGAEYSLAVTSYGAWTAKIEYLYTDLGEQQFIDTSGPGAGPVFNVKP